MDYGVIVGIVLGCLAFIGGVLTLLFVYVRNSGNCKKKRDEKQDYKRTAMSLLIGNEAGNSQDKTIHTYNTRSKSNTNKNEESEESEEESNKSDDDDDEAQTKKRKFNRNVKEWNMYDVLNGVMRII
eukprot:UN03099